ncbi:Multifunctional methyltransferase subunit TRM112-like protein [Hondaea fermentalgiana]|uniref:Multifunctional methyltransferase subunit TRM112-like protein n=1 Tax=Hondaea fermentalgiana TaxID=2315210 RepID=A0A2R5GJB0_9STRA|nr:Multifunctional methyltransferase subunit TRM112-like protein [Hondaea fermentalgiana]|eukprot:GBG29818.1 Multifunctional methyltransferase subunit TRM112-like protein [Hondaea fermentalgiana]
MKLLTHNMLKCNVKGVNNGYPLKIEVTTKEIRETEMNPAFLQGIVEKLEWPVFRAAAAQLGEEGLPEAVTPELLEQEDFLKKFHRALLEVVVVEGALICPESGRKFTITNGIPNMLLNEDEV